VHSQPQALVFALRRAIGRVLEGESREEMERIAKEDERMARAGLVKLKRGERVFYKHIDDLTPEDRRARIAAERDTIVWLKRLVMLLCLSRCQIRGLL